MVGSRIRRRFGLGACAYAALAIAMAWGSGAARAAEAAFFGGANTVVELRRTAAVDIAFGRLRSGRADPLETRFRVTGSRPVTITLYVPATAPERGRGSRSLPRLIVRPRAPGATLEVVAPPLPSGTVEVAPQVGLRAVARARIPQGRGGGWVAVVDAPVATRVAIGVGDGSPAIRAPQSVDRIQRWMQTPPAIAEPALGPEQRVGTPADGRYDPRVVDPSRLAAADGDSGSSASRAWVPGAVAAAMTLLAGWWVLRGQPRSAERRRRRGA